jgi:asparagine synthase (glutamine-hydrolysing)
MAGIAGIAQSGRRAVVDRMLDRIQHRGPAGREIIETPEATLGVVWPAHQHLARSLLLDRHIARDGAGKWHLAQAQAADGHLILIRDNLGFAPLYYGWTSEGHLGFASEVKALLELTRHVHEFPTGSSSDGTQVRKHYEVREEESIPESPEVIAKELRRRLESSVRKRLSGPVTGCWLSGGLDSSTIAALARPHVEQLHTFAVGLQGAPDLELARETAEFVNATHHELVVTVGQLLAVLPKVVYHLESFDTLLVRSSLMNFLVGKLSSRSVPAVFSGEVGDELLAGYEYLQLIPFCQLGGELIDIANRLHNTAFQRVDRSASAHGIAALVPFADGQVLEYAVRIPVEYKLRDGIEKWILRKSFDGLLPERVLRRTKSKFWEGTGLGCLLAQYAEDHVTDGEFRQERVLANGWTIRSKEELLYYRVFREHFGELQELSWMGRTKGAAEASLKPAFAAEEAGS